MSEEARIRYAWRVLSVVSLASILIALGSSSLNVALPEVVRHFHAGAAAAGWMLLSFMLASTVLMVVFGRLADMYGRRAMYLLGLATYTGASLLLGFSPGEWYVVGLRVFQAAGGAMLLANSAALLTDAFPRRQLGRGMGIYIASFSVAQLVGPTLGGFLTHRFGWQWVFWYNVPVGLACLAWGAFTLRRTGGSSGDKGIDLPGNLLVLVSLGGLLFGLSQVGDRGWTDPLVLGGIVVFAGLLPVFVLVERRSRHPVVDVGLFADRVFALDLLAAFLSTVARMAVVLLIALFYQAVRGEDPVSAGLRILPLSVTMMIVSACAGPLHARFGARAVALAGNLVGTAGLVVLLACVSAGGGYAPILAALVLLGAGGGMFMPATATAVLDELPAHSGRHRQRDAPHGAEQRGGGEQRPGAVPDHDPAGGPAETGGVRRHPVAHGARRGRPAGRGLPALAGGDDGHLPARRPRLVRRAQEDRGPTRPKALSRRSPPDLRPGPSTGRAEVDWPDGHR